MQYESLSPRLSYSCLSKEGRIVNKLTIRSKIHDLFSYQLLLSQEKHPYILPLKFRCFPICLYCFKGDQYSFIDKMAVTNEPP